MKKTIYFPEIFEELGEYTKKADKIAVLHKYANVKGLKNFLYITYDPNIKWGVTRSDVENLKYDHMDIADFDLAPTNLFLEAPKRLFNFTNVRNPILSVNKIQKNMARMFSVMHHDEIELVKQAIDRKIKVNGLTAKLVKEAFPNLLTEKVKEAK